MPGPAHPSRRLRAPLAAYWRLLVGLLRDAAAVPESRAAADRGRVRPRDGRNASVRFRPRRSDRAAARRETRSAAGSSRCQATTLRESQAASKGRGPRRRGQYGAIAAPRRARRRSSRWRRETPGSTNYALGSARLRDRSRRYRPATVRLPQLPLAATPPLPPLRDRRYTG